MFAETGQNRFLYGSGVNGRMLFFQRLLIFALPLDVYLTALSAVHHGKGASLSVGGQVCIGAMDRCTMMYQQIAGIGRNGSFPCAQRIGNMLNSL